MHLAQSCLAVGGPSSGQHQGHCGIHWKRLDNPPAEHHRAATPNATLCPFASTRHSLSSRPIDYVLVRRPPVSGWNWRRLRVHLEPAAASSTPRQDKAMQVTDHVSGRFLSFRSPTRLFDWIWKCRNRCFPHHYCRPSYYNCCNSIPFGKEELSTRFELHSPLLQL
ncbi:hypothetical protein T440DRAFT_63290 [Plenodomus tracheiphilus IPT5]|uniref:Uncharacterized protein n=1 Tax=Plenodomus tracheiphilus IPT5 TaxID=1408161 RepID=A0A6A7B9L1_9PLEO|nr:hypothetical protein T440DRAFT_63290 [Plenodomus tracheiphilus IPT5]